MKKIKQFFSSVKLKVQNLFKRKNNVKDKKPTLKFKHRRFPKVIVASKHNFKKAWIFIVPLLVGGAGVTLGLLTRAKPDLEVNVEITDNKVNHRVFLLTDDNMVVPLSVSLEQKMTKAEEVMDIFNLLKDDCRYQNNTIRGYIPKETKLNAIDIENGLLTLDVTSEFETLPKKSIMHVVEALTYTFTSIDGVDSLRFRVDGCLVDKLAGDYQIPTVLNKSIGINRRLTSLSGKQNKEEVVMLYNRKIEQKNYYIPMTVDATKGETRVETVLNAIELKPSTHLNLQKVKEYSYLNLSNKPVVNEQTVSLDITKSGMVDEVTISKELYDLMNLTFDYSDIDLKVNLTFEGEDLAVDGVIDENDYQVSEIVYNEVKL